MATLASDPLLRRSTRKVARTYKAAVTTSIASADRTPATMRAPQKAPIRKIFRPTVSKSEVPPATNASTTPKVCVSEPPDLQQLCISQAQLILTLNHDVARHLRRITELEMLCTSQGSPVQGATIISREPALQSLRSDTIPAPPFLPPPPSLPPPPPVTEQCSNLSGRTAIIARTTTLIVSGIDFGHVGFTNATHAGKSTHVASECARILSLSEVVPMTIVRESGNIKTRLVFVEVATESVGQLFAAKSKLKSTDRLSINKWTSRETQKAAYELRCKRRATMPVPVLTDLQADPRAELEVAQHEESTPRIPEAVDLIDLADTDPDQPARAPPPTPTPASVPVSS